MELKVSMKKKGPIFEGKTAKIVNKDLTAAMYEATQLLEREVKKRTPAGVMGAQAGLRSGIHGEVTGKGTPRVKGIVAAHASHKYAEVIEKGRRANKAWPPEGVLLRWIQVKFGESAETAQRLEFVIRRKIGRKGFPGVHMFENALNENWTKIKKIFDKAGYKIARDLGGK